MVQWFLILGIISYLPRTGLSVTWLVCDVPNELAD